jgi:hypothetical protein
MTDINQQIEQARARLQDLQAKARKTERHDDTRRKILYGAAYLAGLRDLPKETCAASAERVHKYVVRPKDREFLGLPQLAALRAGDLDD